MGTMKQQLTLVDTTANNWHLDDRTRTIGRNGIASAREILQDARRRQVVEQKAAA
jgi:hypothetical protein